jgi:hypothetical protein
MHITTLLNVTWRACREEEEAAALQADKVETEPSSLPPLSKFNAKSVKADFSSPALQQQQQQHQPGKKSPAKSPGKGDWTDVDVFEVDEHGELLFNDAPVSLPSLTPLEKSSYFGSRARFEFLDIFRQLSRQRYNFIGNKFMTFDSVIEEVANSKLENLPSKPKVKRTGGARFSSIGTHPLN